VSATRDTTLHALALLQALRDHHEREIRRLEAEDAELTRLIEAERARLAALGPCDHCGLPFTTPNNRCAGHVLESDEEAPAL